MYFRDRHDAGRQLAALLTAYGGRKDVFVLALPRGGVPVGFDVAQALNVPLDAFVVRKLGVPGHEELAMGALASSGVRVLNRDTIDQLEIPPSVIEHVTVIEHGELQRQERLYRADRPPPDVKDHTVILVDDGLATGSTMRAAAAALRRQQPTRIVVAVPTAAPQTADELRREVDEVVCVITPQPFYAVGLWYHDFSETSDEEVRNLLAAAAGHQTQAA